MKKTLIIGIIILSFISSLYAQKTVKLSPKSLAVTDGKIDEAEWKDAASFDLSGGGKIYLKHDGNYIYVAVKGVKPGWTHLYLSEGDDKDISVLHASAALGKVIYRKDSANLWQPLNEFAWELRDRVFTEAVRQKMADYIAKNYWTANNNNMGNKAEVEFQIKLQNSAAKEFKMSLVYAIGEKTFNFFPSNLADDSLKPELVAGNRVENVKFNVNQWAKVVLNKK